MGAYKPDAEFFRIALERDNLVAEESLFIDDSIRNVQAAEALGIKGLHVRQNEDWAEELKAYLDASR